MPFHPSQPRTAPQHRRRAQTTSATSARTLRTAIKIILQDDCRRRRVEPCLSRLASPSRAGRDGFPLHGSRVARPAASPAAQSVPASCRANCSTRGVMSVAVPSSRRGRPTTIAADAVFLGREARNLRHDDVAPHRRRDPPARSTPSGRASVPVTSLTATPMRRSPTSSPTNPHGDFILGA